MAGSFPAAWSSLPFCAWIMATSDNPYEALTQYSRPLGSVAALSRSRSSTATPLMERESAGGR